jgi:hypothetical protein
MLLMPLARRQASKATGLRLYPSTALEGSSLAVTPCSDASVVCQTFSLSLSSIVGDCCAVTCNSHSFQGGSSLLRICSQVNKSATVLGVEYDLVLDCIQV